MKILNYPRCTGKTTELVKLAGEGEYPIIVSTEQKKKKLKEYILTSPYSIEVFTVQEFLHGLNGAKFSMDNKICIDDMEEVLQAIVGFEIAYATCTIPESKNEKL